LYLPSFVDRIKVTCAAYNLAASAPQTFSASSELPGSLIFLFISFDYQDVTGCFVLCRQADLLKYFLVVNHGPRYQFAAVDEIGDGDGDVID